MSQKEKLSESLEKDQKKKRSVFPHSRAYHRFFSGYSEFNAPRADGRSFSIQRVYTGNYYSQDLTARQRTWLRLRLACAYLVAVLLFGWSATRPLPVNTQWYMVITQAASLFFLSWVFISFIYYFSAPTRMTVAEYRFSSLGFTRASFGAVINLGLGALAAVLYALLHGSEPAGPVLLCGLGFLLAALASLTAYRTERGVPYLIIPSENKAPEDSVEIQ